MRENKKGREREKRGGERTHAIPRPKGEYSPGYPPLVPQRAQHETASDAEQKSPCFTVFGPAWSVVWAFHDEDQGSQVRFLLYFFDTLIALNESSLLRSIIKLFETKLPNFNKISKGVGRLTRINNHHGNSRKRQQRGGKRGVRLRSSRT